MKMIVAAAAFVVATAIVPMSEAADPGVVLVAEAAVTSDNVVDVYMEEMNSIVGALEKVDSQATAHAAAERLQQANVRLEEVATVLRGKSQEELSAMITPYIDELKGIQQRMSAAVQAIIARDPNLFTSIGDAMGNLPALR